MSILSKIQAELKAPKSQYNDFGKFNYRSCEDILEALKPLLYKYESSILMDDEVAMVGSRYYIRATVTIFTADGNFTARALAREPEAKKGMDESQITGSASSYARKYALSALLAIDDSKDADYINTSENLREPTRHFTGQKPGDYKVQDLPVQDKKEEKPQDPVDALRESFDGKVVSDSNPSDGNVFYPMRDGISDKVAKFEDMANEMFTSSNGNESCFTLDNYLKGFTLKGKSKGKTVDQMKEQVIDNGTFETMWQKFQESLNKKVG